MKFLSRFFNCLPHSVAFAIAVWFGTMTFYGILILLMANHHHFDKDLNELGVTFWWTPYLFAGYAVFFQILNLLRSGSTNTVPAFRFTPRSLWEMFQRI